MKVKNETIMTGGIEMVMKSLVVLNESKKNLPIEVCNSNRAKETLRLDENHQAEEEKTQD